MKEERGWGMYSQRAETKVLSENREAEKMSTAVCPMINRRIRTAQNAAAGWFGMLLPPQDINYTNKGQYKEMHKI